MAGNVIKNIEVTTGMFDYGSELYNRMSGGYFLTFFTSGPDELKRFTLHCYEKNDDLKWSIHYDNCVTSVDSRFVELDNMLVLITKEDRMDNHTVHFIDKKGHEIKSVTIISKDVYGYSEYEHFMNPIDRIINFNIRNDCIIGYYYKGKSRMIKRVKYNFDLMVIDVRDIELSIDEPYLVDIKTISDGSFLVKDYGNNDSVRLIDINEKGEINWQYNIPIKNVSLIVRENNAGLMIFAWISETSDIYLIELTRLGKKIKSNSVKLTSNILTLYSIFKTTQGNYLIMGAVGKDNKWINIIFNIKK
jgi:hypothetical protein